MFRTSDDPEQATQVRMFQYLFYENSNSVQTYWESILDSSFVQDLELHKTNYWNVRSNIPSEFHSIVLMDGY